MNFLMLVIQKGREKFAREIAEAYQEQIDARRNVLRVSIDSAVSLEDGVRKNLSDALSKKTGMNVLASFETDEDLIGGLRVTIRDTVYDGSLRTQLDELRERLATSV
jgi:F-type H+-transporting ATPase subunit delta